MKKLFLSLVAFIVTATAMYAQNSLVATLSHGDDITMYYGTNALRDAVNAAESGDIINLSGGSFQAVDIAKAVTIRGAGIDEELPTRINGDFTIEIPSTDSNRFSMEGIRCMSTVNMKGSFENPYFMKSRFNYFYFNNTSVIKNALFVNCKITGNSFSLSGTCSVQFINSYVSNFTNDSEANSSASFVNCIIRPQGGYEVYKLKSCQFINCILYNNSSNNCASLPNTTIASNCIAINDNGRMNNVFNNSQTNPNCGFATYSEMFKDFTGSYSDSQTFELTEEGKDRMVGTDGSEIGLYGGMMPFTSTPSYPQITKMNVASKTTADGKLSVEIEVSAVE